jgi:hypothetical protein
MGYVSDGENASEESEWSLKDKKCDIEIDHRECDIGNCCNPSLDREYKDSGEFIPSFDIEILRQKLIADMKELASKIRVKGEGGLTSSSIALNLYLETTYLGEIEDAINKRFGVKE